jgi:hypothetical protein
MAKATEFRVTVEDKPSALGSCCLAMAQRGVNVLAFQSFVEQGESLARFVVDDPASALAVLSGLRTNFEQDDVAIVTLEHRPGELGRAALLLGEHDVNINYSYCGLELGSSRPLVVFGVDKVTKASELLDEIAAKP